MGIEVWVNKTLNSHRVSCACLAWTSQHDLCRMSRFSANKEVVYPVCGNLGMRTLVGLQETRVCVPTLTDGIGVFQQTRHHTTTPIAHAVADWSKALDEITVVAMCRYCLATCLLMQLQKKTKLHPDLLHLCI